MLLGTALIEEHILAILQEEQKVSVQNSPSIAIVRRQDVFGTEIFTEHNKQDTDIKTLLEATDEQRSTIKHSKTVPVAKQKLLVALSVTSSVVKSKAMGLLNFHPDSNLVIRGCLPAKGFIKALPNRQFFILATNTATTGTLERQYV